MRALARAGVLNALLGLAVLLGASCQGRDPRAAAAETRSGAAAPVPATPAAAPATLAAGTPAGGLADWIADVRHGLAAVTRKAGADPSGASKSALDLYLTRQEYIEMYWGSYGRLNRGSQLGPAVKEAETRFHAILALLQPGRPADAATLRRDVRSLSEQYDQVLALARQSGAVLDPHQAVSAGGGGAR